MGGRKQTFEEVLDKVHKTDTCWYWLGSLSQAAYGETCFNGERLLAHRFIFDRLRGIKDPTAFLLHACDTPFCVNPDHLHEGTQSENMREVRTKGRFGKNLTWTRAQATEFLKPLRASRLARRVSAIAGLPYTIAAQIEITPSCWNWTGFKNDRGYGRINIERTSKGLWPEGAHRWIYKKLKGPIAEGLVVRHTCDNPACVNPQHLLLGTVAQNVQDRLDHGRQRYGEQHQNSKYSDVTVSKILQEYADGLSSGEISRHRGIPKGTVIAIVSGNSRTKTTRPDGFKVRDSVGENNAMHKITAADVGSMRVDLKSGKATLKSLARKFSVSLSAVSLAVRGVTWSAAPGEALSKGDFNASCKLTAPLVLRIKKALKHRKETQHALAKKFSVSQASISLLATGKTWAHVN